MREILFRGKRIDSDEWVYGSFCMDALEQFNGLCGVDGFIRLYNKAEGKMQMHEVDRETVGQYTGLKDKNGKRIFEGDICSVGNLKYKVEFKHSAWWFTILSNKVYCCPAFNSHCGEYCEVIGNIHDNPELMEGEHGGS